MGLTADQSGKKNSLICSESSVIIKSLNIARRRLTSPSQKQKLGKVEGRRNNVNWRLSVFDVLDVKHRESPSRTHIIYQSSANGKGCRHQSGPVSKKKNPLISEEKMVADRKYVSIHIRRQRQPDILDFNSIHPLCAAAYTSCLNSGGMRRRCFLFFFYPRRSK